MGIAWGERLKTLRSHKVTGVAGSKTPQQVFGLRNGFTTTLVQHTFIELR